MGANLLRFALWKRTGVQPVAGIITGERNPRAAAFGAREHVHEVISLAKDKGRAFDGFCGRHRIEPARVLFFFDDVLDLDVARRCGVRMMIGRNSAPLLRKFTRDNGLVDYVTAHSGGQHGLREACELVMGLLGLYDEVVAQRMEFADPYQAYLAERQAIATESLQG
jgi:3-deoxy-D-manno-octulosonate 8-phosphate phosphatase (KDO 8-P phosphatase)